MIYDTTGYKDTVKDIQFYEGKLDAYRQQV